MERLKRGTIFSYEIEKGESVEAMVVCDDDRGFEAVQFDNVDCCLISIKSNSVQMKNGAIDFLRENINRGKITVESVSASGLFNLSPCPPSCFL